MADLGFGGRVLAGEDSEEDEEEEEELGFSFSAKPPVPPVQPTVQPRFIAQAPAMSPGEDSESEEEKDAEKEEADVDVPEAVATGAGDRSARASVDSSARSVSRPTTPELPLPTSAASSHGIRAEDLKPWPTGESIDGAAMMGHAIVQKLQPSLDSTIRRIAELTENQQRLLTVLSTQHKEVCSNDQIENVAIVMGKLPQYIRKVHGIKAAMVEITASVDRMKKRSEILRVDAQSYAIKKENKRESLSQWNKLYAAKSYEGVTMSTTISSSVSVAQEQPSPPS